MANSLFEKKQEIKKEWETCFKHKMEEVLNAKGIAKYWSDETSIREALDMLTAAGVALYVDELMDNADGVIVVGVKGEKEPEEQYQVYNKVTKEFYDHVFTSKEDADEFVVREACNSEFKFSDFRVVQVYD